jgi:hypothetical protein
MTERKKKLTKVAALSLTGGLAALLSGVYGEQGTVGISKAEACSSDVTCFILSCSESSPGSSCDTASCSWGSACGGCPLTCC